MTTEIIKADANLTEYKTISQDLMQRFINYLDASEKTITTYAKSLRQLFIFFASNGITQPTREDIIAYKEYLLASGHKATTVQGYMTPVRLFFSWTAQEGLYPNVAEHVKAVKVSKEHKKDYFTSSQVKEILGDIEKESIQGLRDYAILALMFTGSLRTIEISRANVGDIRNLGDNTVLYIQGKGKTEKADYVKLSPQVEKAIRAYLIMRGSVKADDPLFSSLSNNSSGNRLSTRSISGIAKSRFKMAGFDDPRLTAHSARHTGITLAYLAGEDVVAIKQYARHENIATTMQYLHELDKAKNTCGDAVANAIF